MGGYRARDLLMVPSLISMARLPLAAAFALCVGHPALAFGVLCAAGATDVLDGWYARRFDQVTVTGTVVDPITDKLFVLTVVVTLVVTGKLEIWAVLLLSTRELGELPLLLWLGFSRQARRNKKEHPTANVTGKLATVSQFATVAAALFRSPATGWLLWVTAGAGAVAAVVYWIRALRVWRRARGMPLEAH